MAAMFFVALRDIDLKPEQKTAVDGIESDLEKLGDEHKDIAAKLSTDVADGVAAGKIDHKKTDADIKDLGKAVEGTIPAYQDAITKLYKTLDADQRKKLVDNMRAHAEEMKQHGMMGEHGGMGHGGMEHGMMGEHGGPPGAGAAGGPPGAGPAGAPASGAAGAPPAGAGPGMGHGMGHEGHEGHEGDMHGMMLEKLSTDLGLTPEQKDKLGKKLDAYMKTQEAEMKARMAAQEKHMKAIGDAFAGDKFDAKKVGVGTQAPTMAKEMATSKVTFAETVLGVLTPEQRAKFADHIRAHANDMD
jgi:Spy/CpxP family protein refolding chaperone